MENKLVKKINNNNVLVLEKRGCDFWKDDKEIQEFSDLENYRVFCKGLSVNGKILFIDFMRGHKIEKKKTVHHHKLSMYTYLIEPYDENLCIENPQQWGFTEIEEKTKDYDYTQKDILKFINSINDFKIEQIYIFDSFYNRIRSIAGYRENTILNLCNKIQLIMDTPDHKVFRLWSPATSKTEERYFDYDYITNTIVG